MANIKITDLTPYTSPISTDVIPIVDVTLGVTKKITNANFSAGILASAFPSSATDNAITRFDGTTGKLVQNSGITISDTFGGTNLITVQATGELNLAAGDTNNIDFTVNGGIAGFVKGSDGSFQWGASAGLGLIIDQNGNLTQINQLNYNWTNVDAYGMLHRDSTGNVTFSPGVATVDNTIARYDGVQGKVQTSLTKIGDTGELILPEQSAPSATANYGKLYVKSSDSLPYFKTDAGVEYSLTTGGATYIYNVLTYGAIGDGVTDNSTAVQNAINAANAAGGGTVFFPDGTYLCNTVLTLKSFVKIEGNGNASIIKCSGGNNLFTFSSNIARLEFYNVKISATAGHIFYNTNSAGKFNYSNIHHCWFSQNSTDKALWYQTAGNLISLIFEENYVFAAGATRTVPVWYNVDPSGSCNSNWWRYNTWECEGSVGEPVFYISGTSATDYTYDNHFFEEVFEVCDGGGITLLSNFNATIENVSVYDNLSRVSPWIYIGKSTTGIRSTGTSIRNCVRIGSNFTAGTKDITFESTSRNIVIDSCRATPDSLAIEMNSCTDVTIINRSPGTTITNLASGGSLNAAFHDNGGMGYDIKAFGAKGDGTTNDATAIQACIDYVNAAGGGTVLIPVGTFLVNTVLTFYTKIKFQGQGYTSQIKISGGNNMFTWSGSCAFNEFSSIRFVAAAGHIFSPAASANLSQCRFDKCWFSEATSSKAVWNQTTGSLSNATFYKCDFYVSGASRSIPAFYLLDTTAGSHDNHFEECVCTYADACNNQYFFYLECTAGANGYLYAPQFRKMQFDTCDGGNIKLLSVFGAVLDDVWSTNNVSLVAPAILIDKSATAAALSSSANTMRNLGRINGTVGGGGNDIKLGSSTRQTVIENFRCTPDNGTIDLNSSSDNSLDRISSGTTISNVSSTTLIAKNAILTGMQQINDENGNEQVIFSTTASAINELTLKNAAAGNAPAISATGGDTDINVNITPKGAGVVVLGTALPLASGGTAGTTAAAARASLLTKFVVPFFSISSTPAASTTYYFGATVDSSFSGNTTAAIRQKIIPFATTLRGASITIIGVANSTDTFSIYARINNTTDVTLTSAAAVTTTAQYFSNNALSTAIAAGDKIEIKVVTPAWAIPPTAVRIIVDLYFE